MVYVIEPLGALHDREAFRCGNDVVDTACLEAHLAHDKFRRRTYVAREDGSHVVLGFYSLHMTVIGSGKAKKYADASVQLSMIGVDTTHQNKGLGKALIADALVKVYQIAQLVGAEWLWLEAANADVAEFYRKLGFDWLNETKLTLYLPIKTVIATVEGI